MELLAPAGNLNILKIAIQAGCDAVYISGKNYGARKSADNFTNEELLEAVNYAHLRNKLVYVTVNTLIYDDEFNSLHEYLEYLDQIKIDALIVQDLGVIHYIRKNFPNLIVHASTQLNINSRHGALRLLELGVKRVVLARETPLEIVKEIIDTGIEVELFVHGALCFSCSGQCLMSYSIGGRSGNRGECAQPCRKKYQLLENNQKICKPCSLMSMKDLNTLDELQTLEKLKVTSLKIEGRLKSASYVSTVVKIYRNNLDQIHNKNDEKELYLAFNRKFTKGYLFNENNQNITNNQSVNHQGYLVGKIKKVNQLGIWIEACDELTLKDGIRIVGKKEIGFYISNLKKEQGLYFISGNFSVAVNDLVYKTVSNDQFLSALNLLKSENYQISLRAELYIHKDEKLCMIIDGMNRQIKVSTIQITELAKIPLSNTRIKEQIMKTGDSLFKIMDVNIYYDNLCFIKISELNEIRRIALNRFKEELLTSYPRQINLPYIYNDRKIVNNNYNRTLKFEFIVHTEEQYNWCKHNGFNNVYVNMTNNNELNYNRHLNFNIPIYNGLIHNLGEMNKGLAYSSSCNILNKQALEILENYEPDIVYLSNELNKKQICELGGVKTSYDKGIFLYGRMLLLVSHHCFISKIKMTDPNCQMCQKNKYYLSDEYSNKMFVHANCNKFGPELLLYDYHKTNRFSDLNDYVNHGINRFLIVLTDETILELDKLNEMIKKGEKNAK